MLSRKAKRTTSKIVKNVKRALPRVRIERRASSVMPILFGVLGVATIGGVAAVLLANPRTRRRTLDVMKEAYGKLAHELEAIGVPEKLGMRPPAMDARTANGLTSETPDYSPNAF